MSPSRWQSRFSLYRLRLFQPLCAALLAFAGAGSVALAQRDGVADALAGHGAELRQAQGDANPMRRAFFYDPVDVEGPNPGVPCDHIAARRPEVVAGQGTVVLIESDQTPPRRLRYWLGPNLSQAAPAVSMASDYARQQGWATFRVLGQRSFAWCR